MAMLTVEQLLSIGQSIAVFQAVHYGLGRHQHDLRASAFEDMEKVRCVVLRTIRHRVFAADF